MNDLMIENNTALRDNHEAGPSQSLRAIRRTLPLVGLSLAAAIMTGCGGGSSSSDNGGGPVGGFEHAGAKFASDEGNTYASSLDGNSNNDIPMYQQGFGGLGSESNFRVRSGEGGTNISIETPDGTYSWNDVDKGSGLLTAENTGGNRTNRIESRYLDYTHFGVWDSRVVNDALVQVSHEGGAFHQGFETKSDNMPGTGSATYTGEMVGIVSSGGQVNDIAGQVSMNADFGTNKTNGSIDTGGSFNDITLASGNISGNSFSGQAKTDASSVAGSFATGTSGNYQGRFYGPSADEAAGSFLIKSGSDFAAGGFGGSKEAMLPVSN